jgi:hypothetical protein
MRGEHLRKMGSANVNSVFHNVGRKNPNNRMNNNNNNNNQAFKNAKIYQEMLKRNTNLVRRGVNKRFAFFKLISFHFKE